MIDARPGVGLIWDNFGPTHSDRCAGLAETHPEYRIVGLELFPNSNVYEWERLAPRQYSQLTLFATDDRDKVGFFAMATRIVRECLRVRLKYIFVCHYQWPAIFAASCILRILGKRVYIMGNSKFDDRPRHFWREAGKRLLYVPYCGALAGSPRSADYQRFLGVPADKIELGYNSVSIERMKACEGDAEPAAFEARAFVCVARLVPKKNHRMLFEAYALYLEHAENPRQLVLCGSGPLRAELENFAKDLGIRGHVIFRGNLTSAQVAGELARGLCLVLPSYDEQFGFAIIEALIGGRPVIVGENCGARDVFVRNGVNGFVVERDNVTGLAWFMTFLGENEGAWCRMSKAAGIFARGAGVSSFASGVTRLISAG
jgi:glycosyltransferase involved in cell wall biosynthesis